MARDKLGAHSNHPCEQKWWVSNYGCKNKPDPGDTENKDSSRLGKCLALRVGIGKNQRQIQYSESK